MSTTTRKTLGVLGGLALVGLNLAIISFFALWQIADTAAINRMESTSGFDESQMLPNSNLLWLAAHASLLLVLVVDVVAIAIAVMPVKAHRAKGPTTRATDQSPASNSPQTPR